MAAGGAILEAAGRVAREEEGQREATGGGGGRPRRVGASTTETRRPGSLSTAPASVPSVGGGENRAGGGRKGIRAILQFQKFPGTSL